ncbi:MAG: hypothetical protein U9Q70_10110 [Chloroflexota bacterium]|nr:hypothetical protein [Chloroflexota bacterium]
MERKASCDELRGGMDASQGGRRKRQRYKPCPETLHYWQLTEQLPHTVFVQSTTRKYQRGKEILGITFRFVTVVETKFCGVAQRMRSWNKTMSIP